MNEEERRLLSILGRKVEKTYTLAKTKQKEFSKLKKKMSELENKLKELDWWNQVLDFHRACNIFIGTTPAIPNKKRIDLRFRIIEEEYNEMLEARDKGDLVALADGMADVIVTVLGTAIEYGIDLRPIMNEVNRTNLAKAGGPRREDGKILKPEGWQPPDVKGCLEKQGSIK